MRTTLSWLLRVFREEISVNKKQISTMIEKTIPSSQMLEKAAQQKIYDADGKAVTLESIFSQQDVAVERLLVIFIRHFLCGNCQEYIRRISDQMRPSSLPVDVSIVIIGCGVPSHIHEYVRQTECPFQMYADPSTKLYDMLGMHRTLSLGNKAPEYIQHSLIKGALQSVMQGMKRMPAGDALSAGEFSVNGGEFFFSRSEHRSRNDSSLSFSDRWTVPWCHQMENTRDHTEVHEIQAILGLKTTRPSIAKRQSTASAIRRSLSPKHSNKYRRSASSGRTDTISVPAEMA